MQKISEFFIFAFKKWVTLDEKLKPFDMAFKQIFRSRNVTYKPGTQMWSVPPINKTRSAEVIRQENGALISINQSDRACHFGKT